MNYTFAPSAPAPLLRKHLHLGGSNPKGGANYRDEPLS